MKNLVYAVGSLLCAIPSWAQQKPNIVMIVADDMRGATINPAGKENLRTPVLDGLSGKSTVFTNAHIMGGTSGAVSMPSRAMLMTGKYLYRLEERGATIPADHLMIGEVLSDAGYETFHTGKWHNGKSAFNRCFSSGRDIFFGGMADHWNVPLFGYDPSGNYEDKRRVITNPQANNAVEIRQGEYVFSGKHSVDIFTRAAVDFIEGRKEQQEPFFLSLCYMSPHDPRSMPDEFMQMYPPEEVALPANYLAEHPFDNGELRVRDEVLAAIPRVESEVKRHIAEYYAMISHLDSRVGDVIEALKANGLYDNTIIIFTADNGLAVGQHGLLGKQNVYEHSVCVPLLIKEANGTAERKQTDRLCYLIDLFPTICDWAGQPVPASVDGVSLLPVLKSDEPVRDYLYYGYRDFQRGVSDGEWKLIDYHVKGETHTQLFNLKDDPMEIENRSGEQANAERVKQLRDKMRLLKQCTGDDSSFWEE